MLPKLEHQVTLPVFGHPVTYRTNSARVLVLIKEYYGHWAALKPHLVTNANFVISVTLDESRGIGTSVGTDRNAAPVRYRLPSVNQLYISTTGSSAHVDVDRGVATADVNLALFEHTEHFRTGVLDTMTLMLVTSIDRCPVHAAAALVNDHLVLLVGSSGTGKSTLAYALHSAGYDVLSDDTIYVQLAEFPRLWFFWRAFGLLPEAANGFGELIDVEPMALSTGKTKVVVPTHGPPRIDPWDLEPTVCVLGRGEQASLTELPADHLRSMLNGRSEAGFDRLAVQRGPVLDWLARRGGWRLTLSPHVSDAVSLLRNLQKT